MEPFRYRYSLADALHQLALKPDDAQSLFEASSAAWARGFSHAFAPIVEAASRAWPSNLNLACFHANVLGSGLTT